MKPILSIFICAAIIVPASTWATSSPEKNQEAAAVTLFERLVAEAQAKKLSSRTVQRAETGKWTRIDVTQETAVYDIKRTDSLITPFIAQTKFKHSRTISGWHDTEDEAASATASESTKSTYSNTFTYGFSNGSWKLKSARSCYWLNPTSERDCLVIEHTRETLQKSETPGWAQ